MRKEITLTQDYIEGSQDMLSSLTTQFSKSLERYEKTPKGVVNAVNEFISYLHLKQSIVEDMIYELAKMQEFDEDPFDEQACTEEVIGYVFKNGKIYEIYEGEM